MEEEEGAHRAAQDREDLGLYASSPEGSPLGLVIAQEEGDHEDQEDGQIRENQEDEENEGWEAGTPKANSPAPGVVTPPGMGPNAAKEAANLMDLMINQFGRAEAKEHGAPDQKTKMAKFTAEKIILAIRTATTDEGLKLVAHVEKMIKQALGEGRGMAYKRLIRALQEAKKEGATTPGLEDPATRENQMAEEQLDDLTDLIERQRLKYEAARAPAQNEGRQPEEETQESQYSLPTTALKPGEVKTLMGALRELRTINEEEDNQGANVPEALKKAGQITANLVSIGHIITILLLASISVTPIAASELSKPGDTIRLGDIAITLHEDKTGYKLLSATVTQPTITYAHATQTMDFTKAATYEQDLQSLVATMVAGHPKTDSMTAVTPIFSDPTTTAKQACNCHLSTPPHEPDNDHQNTWVMDHRELATEGCTQEVTGDRYETTMDYTTGQGQCHISPTPTTKTTTVWPYEATATAKIVKEINEQKRCITKGAFNLNMMPTDRITTVGPVSLVHCQMECHFSKKCTAWMYKTTHPTQCWLLNIGDLQYRYTRYHENDTTIYTGDSDCLPCNLDRRVQTLRKDEWTDAKSSCTLNWGGRDNNNLTCPCDTASTYQDSWADIAKLELKTRTNSITGHPSQDAPKPINPKINRILQTTKPATGTQLQLSDILTGASWVMKAFKGLNPAAHANLKKLQPIAQIKRLLEPARQITTTMIKAQDLTDKNRPKRSTKKTKRETGVKANTLIPKLLEGSLQTRRAITQAIKGLDAFLTARDLAKRRYTNDQAQLTDGRSELYDPNTHIPKDANAIVITADKGTTTTRVAIFPIEEGPRTAHTTIIPVPTDLENTDKEANLPRGTIELRTGAIQASAKTPPTLMCAMQLAGGNPHPTACTPQGPPIPITEVQVEPIRSQQTLTRLVRICVRDDRLKQMYITCNGQPHMIRSKGTTVISLPAACRMTSLQGHIRVEATLHTTTNDTRAHILYNGPLRGTPRQWTEQDTIHIITLALITLLILNQVKRWWHKRPTNHYETLTMTQYPEHHNHSHEEAGTPFPETPRRDRAAHN